jgi:hypothetical protein
MHRIDILQKIREQQTSSDNRYFNQGLFPSFRTNQALGITRADNNIFFSISTLYILNSIQPYLQNKEKQIIAKIKDDLLPNLRDYTNKPERNSFNFWPKEAHKHFPNGMCLHHFEKFKLPDDIDTTSIAQLVEPIQKKEAFKTKQAICAHANLVNKRIKNGHPQFYHLKAYSTWFGENMPIEFDICVLSNYLLWLNFYGFEHNEYDKASIHLIEQNIEQSLYFKSPFKSAPEYPKTAIILYHLARVISTTPYLQKQKDKVVQDLKYEFKNTQNQFFKMITSSSLLKLGIKTKQLSPHQLSPYFTKQWWFTAGLLSVYSYPIIQTIAPKNAFHFRFYCPAFNLSLLLENMVSYQNTPKTDA